MSGDDSAFGLGVRLPNNTGWRGGAVVKELQRNFMPALGFISRSDVRDTAIDAGYTHFPRSRFVQSMFFGVDGQRISFLDGGLQSEVMLGRLLGQEGLITLNHSLQDRDRNGAFQSDLLDVSVKLNYTFRF